MKHKILYSKESRRDLDEIWDYIASELQNPIAAERIEDQFIEVPDAVAEELRASGRAEAAHQRQLVRNKAQYSLDCDDGIEYSACVHEPTPEELLERMELFYRLWNALNSLPETQGHRVDAHIILGMSYREIARAEGVDKSAVRRSVLSGIMRMKKYLRKNL